MLSVRLLGPLEVERDGERLPSPSRRTRTLLAALALMGGRVVSRDRLVEVVWGDDPPESIGTQVAIQVSKLRKQLGAASIETVGRGYRLNAEAVEVDVAIAERLLERAREQQRPDLFREAQRMWRGPVCDDAHSDEMAPAVQRLEELFLASVEEWAALLLDTGGEADVVTVLPELTARHPLRERLRALLMEALWRCERRGDALALYDEGRHVLAEELGLDPGSELTGLQQRILQDDAAPELAPAVADSRIAVPRQLPTDLSHVVGRDREIKAVEGVLDGTESGAVIALHGTGGVGKTTLAVHLGHRLEDRFPDGQVFLNLRGYGPHEPTDAATALGLLLGAFGVPNATIPDDESDRAALFRVTVAGRRALIVLDNARDSMQVRALLPGGSSVVLVTSRSQLRSLTAREGAHRVAIDPLTTDGAVELLQGRGSGAVWEQAEVAELARLCGHLPVALSVAAERASRYPDRPLAELNAELRDGLATLDVLTAWENDPHTSVRAVVTWSYEALEPDEARMFLLLGLHPSQYYDRYVAAALAAVDLSEAARLLDKLVDANLLAEPRPGELAMHDLVHAYAVLSGGGLTAIDRDDAARRLRAYYIHTMVGGRDRAKADNLPLDIGELPSETPIQTFESEGEVSRWTVDNWVLLGEVLQDAIADRDHGAVYRLAALLSSLDADRGRVEQMRDLVDLAAWHGRAGGVWAADADCCQRLGLLAWRAGRPTAALELFERSQVLCRELGDAPRVAFSLMHQGMALVRLGRVEEAIERYEESLAQRVALRMPTALTLNNLAMSYLAAHRYTDAMAAADRSLEEFRSEGRIREQAQVLDTRGSVRSGSGDHVGAAADFAEAADLFAHLGTSFNTAIVASHLGDEQALLGDLRAARASWERALEVMTDLGASDGVHLTRDGLVQRINDIDASLDAEG
jgi:DNA-binding SARP family transcriptional activator/tetratricopeptide (TPR) repeat protein